MILQKQNKYAEIIFYRHDYIILTQKFKLKNRWDSITTRTMKYGKASSVWQLSGAFLIDGRCEH